LLRRCRAPRPQPAKAHPTRSSARRHAASYDAVNAIDRTRAPYLIRVRHAPRGASQQAAAAAAAHGVLVALYPALSAQIDAQFEESVTDLPDGAGTKEGVANGAGVARRLGALRAEDWSA